MGGDHEPREETSNSPRRGDRGKQAGEDPWEKLRGRTRRVEQNPCSWALDEGGERKQVVQPDRQSRIRQDTFGIAWGKVESNAGACGVDNTTVRHFAKDSQRRLLAVREQIREGRYHPRPVRRVHIEKQGSSETRPLGIPTVTDRVVQSAVKMVIEPIFEREFAPASLRLQTRTRLQRRLREVERLLREGKSHVRRRRHQRLL